MEWGLDLMLINIEVLLEVTPLPDPLVPLQPIPLERGFFGAPNRNPLITGSTDCRLVLDLYYLHFYEGRAWYYVTVCGF